MGNDVLMKQPKNNKHLKKVEYIKQAPLSTDQVAEHKKIDDLL